MVTKNLRRGVMASLENQEVKAKQEDKSAENPKGAVYREGPLPVAFGSCTDCVSGALCWIFLSLELS